MPKTILLFLFLKELDLTVSNNSTIWFINLVLIKRTYLCILSDTQLQINLKW